MAKLTIYQNGAMLLERDLDPASQYILGRSSQCDIVLNHPEISRQHLKIYFEDQKWKAQVVSKFGKISIRGMEVEDFELEDGLHFQIPPFEIRFEHIEDVLMDSGEDLPSVSEDLEIGEDYPSTSSAPSAPSIDAGDDSFDDEKTNVGPVLVKLFLYKVDDDGNDTEKITLPESGIIVAGRSSSCSLQLSDPKASRKHFNLVAKDGILSIKDLGSSNKTYVNEKPISSEIQLNHGDVVRVGTDKFRLEVINPEFENLPAPTVPAPMEATQPAVIKFSASDLDLSSSNQGSGKKSRRPGSNPIIFMTFALAVLGGLAYLIMGGQPKPKEARGPATNSGMPQDPFSRLSPQQQEYVTETRRLAINLFKGGKYELAALEADKVLRLLPKDSDSREIQMNARRALEIEREIEATERQRRAQMQLAQKVSDYLDKCENLLNMRRYTIVEACVEQISNMDPENARGARLVELANEALMKQQNNRQRQQEKRRRAQLAKNLYNQGKQAFSKGKYKQSISKFRRLASISFTDTTGLKGKARKGIKEAKRRIGKQSENLVTQGQTALEVKDYKKAMSSFNKALKLDPSNGDARILKDKAVKEINLAMKALYQEGIIEESTGSIDRAMQKWKSILEQSPPSNQYYRKAKIKTRKYER